MPIYDYFCGECNELQEHNVKIEERENQYCECGNSLDRQITFKGAVFSDTANGGMKI